MTKPLFNTALGALNFTLQPNLPARFKGVTARIFPLKVKMDLLRAFCDSYLNVAPDFVQFQPSLPFVYLMVLNYGRMSAQVENFGWVSQHEVAFAVPLEWYRIENGQPVFVDSATVCPFIFVDNELSLSTGREVYGWPKVKAWLEPEVSPWLDDPRSDVHLLSLSTMLYPELFVGQRQQAEVLLEIRQRRLPSFSQFPPDLANPLGPLLRLPTALMTSLNVLGQLVELITRPPLLGYGSTPSLRGAERRSNPPAMLSSWSNLLRQGARSANVFASPPPQNQITLKQFRDAESPGYACYEAIVNSQIRTTRFNAGGLLGDLHLLGGDLTGGFEILVHRYAAQPIIESLGLDVARETAVGDAAVAVLEPVVPFWVDVDLEYGIGEALCWRTMESAWQSESKSSPSKQQVNAGAAGDKPLPDPFNTALGAAIQDIAGPFEFPNATVRVLPLMADAQRLDELCDKYLNAEVGQDVYRFKPWGSYVYLVVTNYEEMSSPRANIGCWAEREVTFFIPVKWYDAHDPSALLSVALVPIFGFADSGTAAITSREVNGQPTLTAAIKSPLSAWLAESGPSEGTDQGLLTLQTTVFPAVNLGQRAEWRTLLEIQECDALPYNDDIGWRAVADSWGRDLLEDHERKIATKRSCRPQFDNARALAVEILANRRPINAITLKQFRDVSEPLRACYQALVCGRRTIDVAYDIREIEQRIHLSIHRYPSLPIVEMLGLKTKWTVTGAETVDILQPIRPFWMRVALKEELGRNLCSRADETWIHAKEPGPFYFKPTVGEGAGPTDVGSSLVDEINHEHQPYLKKQRLRVAANDWRRRAGEEGGPERLERSAAAASVESIDPQMVIESLLSNEWQNWGNPRWYQGLAEKPDFCIPRGSIGERTTCEKLFGEEQEEWPGWYSEDTKP